MIEPWLDTLRRACEASSQRRVSDRLRRITACSYPSETVISQVLSGTYPGRTERLRDLVESAYLGATVDCPILGEIAREDCHTHQRKPFAATNPIAVQLYRACRGCPNRRSHE